MTGGLPCSCCPGPHGGGRGPTRRMVLGGAMAAAVAMGVDAAGAAAGGRAAVPPGPDLIDVHNHFVPPAFVAWKPDLPAWIRAWRPEHTIESMDRNGVAAAITSLNAPGLTMAEPELARRVSRGCNDYAARMMADHPGRFGMFATLAPLDIDGALREAVYALDVLKADGVGLMTSYGRTYLASETFVPLFEELNRRRAVVFVHPAMPDIGRDFDPPLDPMLLEMPYDSARTLLGMILAGTFRRFPDIRFIFNHGGGGLPVLHKRLDLTFAGDPRLRDRFPDGVMAQLRHVYFDTVNVLNPANFGLLRQLVAMDRLLFGTDFPGFGTEINRDPLMALAPAERHAIGRDNALRLFPRFQPAKAPAR